MTIQDMKFQQELETLRKEYREKYQKYGHMGDTVMKIRVRQLCRRYKVDFESVWKGK